MHAIHGTFQRPNVSSMMKVNPVSHQVAGWDQQTHFGKQAFLITGGSGFLGSNLAETLLKQGEEVVTLDNHSSSDGSNLERLKKRYPNKLHTVQGSIVDAKDVQQLGKQYDFKGIYNMACIASPPGYKADPIGTLKASSDGVENLLKLAKSENARMVHSSTSEVYGNPHRDDPIQTEETLSRINPMGDRGCYDAGKIYAEPLCRAYKDQEGVDAGVVRIFNTYGPGMNPKDGRVIPNYMTQALQGKPLTVYGDGKQTRSLCFVDDLVDGLTRMMDAKGFLGPVNLGNPSKEITMDRLADTVIQVTQTKSPKVYQDLPDSDDPVQRRPGIQRAWEKLGWKPKVSLEEGLQKTVTYFKEVLGEAKKTEAKIPKAPPHQPSHQAAS